MLDDGFPFNWWRVPRPLLMNRKLTAHYIWGSNFVKKNFFEKVHDRILIYTPKDAHSRIFVTGGSVIA